MTKYLSKKPFSSRPNTSLFDAHYDETFGKKAEAKKDSVPDLEEDEPILRSGPLVTTNTKREVHD